VWLAPEILERKAYSEKADVYSLGVIFWELLTKAQFFGEVKFMALLEDMVKAGRRPPIPDSCIPSYRQLIEECWAQDPSTPLALIRALCDTLDLADLGLCDHQYRSTTVVQGNRGANRWHHQGRVPRDR
jgi:serine/threonine protein kinase